MTRSETSEPSMIEGSMQPSPSRWFMTCARSVVIALFTLVPFSPVLAQEHAHGGIEKLGRVVFPVSCNPEAARRFERAMAALHSFWCDQSADAFQAVLKADSTCAMAHWGLAMNAWTNPFAGGADAAGLKRGAAEAERARMLGAPTPREAGFIAAASALYRDAEITPNAVRLRAYSDTLARLHHDLPDDEE